MLPRNGGRSSVRIRLSKGRCNPLSAVANRHQEHQEARFESGRCRKARSVAVRTPDHFQPHREAPEQILSDLSQGRVNCRKPERGCEKTPGPRTSDSQLPCNPVRDFTGLESAKLPLKPFRDAAWKDTQGRTSSGGQRFPHKPKGKSVPVPSATSQQESSPAVSTNFKDMTPEELNKIDKCRHLLPEPAPEVVGKLVEQLRGYDKHLRVCMGWTMRASELEVSSGMQEAQKADWKSARDFLSSDER